MGCRQKGAKRTLVRIVRLEDGSLCADPTGKRPGRGAYVCSDGACIERALTPKSLIRALRLTTPIAPPQIEALRSELTQLVNDGPDGSPKTRRMGVVTR